MCGDTRSLKIRKRTRRASMIVARAAFRSASAGASFGAAGRAALAASCCASIDLLSQPRAMNAD